MKSWVSSGIKLTISISYILILASCAHYPVGTNYSGPAVLPDDIRMEYVTPRQPSVGIPENTVVETTSHYTVRRMEFPSDHNLLPVKGTIRIDYYDLPGDEKTPVIILLPLRHGVKFVTRSFAKYFAKQGYACIIVHQQKAYVRNEFFDRADSIMRQIVMDYIQVIDLVESMDELDNDNIGLFGISMGGITGALISGLDHRIKASVLALAGGDLPYILSYTTDNWIKKERKKYLAEHSMTEEELHSKLQETIECDPLTYARYIDRDNTMMILGKLDTAVPYSKGMELREKIGYPETLTLFSGHKSAFLYLWYAKRKSLRFFQDRLVIPQVK